jgi:hypothetical protein
MGLGFLISSSMRSWARSVTELLAMDIIRAAIPATERLLHGGSF